MRGSQYHVEGVLLRALISLRKSHTEAEAVPDVGYLFPTPTKGQIRDMEALESIPLVMEPKSGFYHHPVVVCDFTALYPSLVIAYNLCYSTICGKMTYQSTLNGGKAETSGRIGMRNYNQSVPEQIWKRYTWPNGEQEVCWASE